jgi:DNA modification methylase
MAKKINTEWRNRIVSSGTMPASQFVANPSNWRIHPKAQREALSGVLNEVGWVQNVIVNKTTGNVVDGHARIEEALKRGDDTPVPYVEVELTEDEEQKILLTLDPISAMAAADKANLDALLKSVETQDAAVMAMIADMADKAGLDYGDSKTLVDAEPQIDKAEELRVKWGVELGQLWQLGDHRLLCGDSTRAEDVARVMGGEKADLVFTDPPYGVNYSDSGKARIQGDMTQVAIPLGFKAAVDIATNENARMYWCGSNKNAPMFFALFDSYCNCSCAQIIWVKPHFVMMHVNYHSQFEVIFFGWKGKGGGPDCWFGNRKSSDVWQENREEDYQHPTQKPVGLPTKAITNSCPVLGTVYDPFLGSGTTMVACQNLGRKCRAIEISPAYVAVALQRWADATGKTPVLITSENTTNPTF